jgi:hypothetical protein
MTMMIPYWTGGCNIKENKVQTAQDVLSQYLIEMTDFERKNAPLISNMELMFTEESQNLRKKDIGEIFNRYLSSKSLAVEQPRLTTVHFQVPPEHEDEIIRVEEKSSKNCSFYTKNKTGGAETRYDLIFERGEWKLDAKAFEGMNWRTMRNQF